MAASRNPSASLGFPPGSSRLSTVSSGDARRGRCGAACTERGQEQPSPPSPALRGPAPRRGSPSWAGPGRAGQRAAGPPRRLMRNRPGWRRRREHGAAGAAAAQAAVLLPAHRPQPLRPPGAPERQGQAAGKAGGARVRGRRVAPCPAGRGCPVFGCASVRTGAQPAERRGRLSPPAHAGCAAPGAVFCNFSKLALLSPL